MNPARAFFGLSLCVVIATGCAAAPDTADEIGSDESALRGGGGGGGGRKGAAASSGDGSFAQCVARSSGFGSIGYNNQCDHELNIMSCDQNNRINPSVRCVNPLMFTMAPHTQIGFTRGHCTAPCGPTDTVADFFASCTPPLQPVPVNGDLSLGYTCK